MSLAGRLEEIELAEILHFLALNNRTGKVTLSRRDAHGVVVVRLGRIVYAASSSIRETFGNILVCRGLVSPDALAEALERQHRAADGRKLGEFLVETGAITEGQLQDALRQQTGLVVQELCRWRSGYFRFEVTPVASSGDIGVDAEELVVAAGVATDLILLEAMTRMDEAAGGGGSRHRSRHRLGPARALPAGRGDRRPAAKGGRRGVPRPAAAAEGRRGAGRRADRPRPPAGGRRPRPQREARPDRALRGRRRRRAARVVERGRPRAPRPTSGCWPSSAARRPAKRWWCR